MKKIIYSFLFLVACLSIKNSNAQSQDATLIYKDWEQLLESTTMVDISYRVIKCSKNPQIHFLVFNENTYDQSVAFVVEVLDIATGKKFQKTVTFRAEKWTIYKATCKNDPTLDLFKIDLPSGYDPYGLKVNVNLK